jgi:hypothetical protein
VVAVSVHIEDVARKRVVESYRARVADAYTAESRLGAERRLVVRWIEVHPFGRMTSG